VQDDARSFRRTLTVILSILGLLTAGSVLLFGHLLFKSLSRDVVADALLHSRLDAERIARGVQERSSGDLYTLKYRQKEIDTFVGSALSERQVLNEVRVFDKTGKLLYAYQSVVTRPQQAATPHAEGEAVVPVPPSNTAPDQNLREITLPVRDPYDIAVPIGDLGVLRVGVSRKELEARVEKLRGRLYARTFAAAIASLLGIGAASAAVIVLYARNRRVEAAHAEAERRAELGEVAAGLAHEIRNPLNAMSLNLELLEEQLGRAAVDKTAPNAVELARSARHETGRLARLLTDFLAYARPSPITPVPADLNDPASDAVVFLTPEAEQRGIHLEFTPRPGGAPAKLDEARVKQVVMNLVGNALDAVDGLSPDRRRVTVGVEEDGDSWRLTVADCGRGVPRDKESEIFGVFVSTKPAGTGLGLPIAERIVKAHGGSLTLSSSAGEPTRAVATFPKA
jgi:signal transduction histidine kinase